MLLHLPNDGVAIADFVIGLLESDFVESGPGMRLIEPTPNLSQQAGRKDDAMASTLPRSSGGKVSPRRFF